MLFLIGSKQFEEYSSECVVNGNGVMYGYGKRMAEKFPVRVQKGKRICTRMLFFHRTRTRFEGRCIEMIDVSLRIIIII